MESQSVAYDNPPTTAPRLSLDGALSAGPNTLIAPKQAAPILGHAISTLARWRAEGSGPRWLKLSRSKVAYKAGDLLEYLNSKQIAA